MGTPDFSVPALRRLIDSGHDVVAVYSQPPRPKGRGQQVQPSPVHLAAEEAGIPVRTPKNFKDQKDVAEFAALNADVAVVVAYGLILPKSILSAPRYGCLNIHASLLPRWRGAAPIHRAVLAGDEETGVTIMQMDEGLDTGAMILTRTLPITKATTSAMLHDGLSALGAEMISDVLDMLNTSGTLAATPQPEDGVTYASKLDKEEGKIDWRESAAAIDRRVRAFTPWPGTWTHVGDGTRLKVLGTKLSEQRKIAAAGTILDKGLVACGDGSVLALTLVQPEGKKPMDVIAAINGGYLKAGSVLA
jgi:methionyl-tRNA formyltransferase